ncbi:MAG: hypothetical protein LN411_01850 [Candidatus Thermoplasmatota archaeon]|nr:hypothetical protein [Candidatus Thermoplasmatota archaeon]
MLCRFLSSDGICAGKYEGYACIRSSCSYWVEAHSCEHHDSTGDYCNKHARFGCVGKESCHTLSEYLQAASEAETA